MQRYVERSGSGRVKHLSTKQLWVQSVVEAFPLQIEKISRSDNCADMLTHSLAEAEAARHGFCLLKLIADLLVKSRGGTRAMQMLQRKCRQGACDSLAREGVDRSRCNVHTVCLCCEPIL